MKKISAWLLLACIALPACRKRDYPEEKVKLAQEPIYVNGEIDGEPIVLSIGTEGYYCYTSFAPGNDSVLVFSGELKKFDCTSCTRALRIDLSDYRATRPGYSVNPDSTFAPGPRTVLPPVARPNTFHLRALSNKPMASARWKFSDGRTVEDTATTHEFLQPGPQSFTLTVRTTMNCENSVISTIYCDPSGDFLSCDITALSTGGNAASFTPRVSGGTPPYTYAWHFGDGSTSNEESATHVYRFPGGYPVKLLVTDAGGRTCETNLNFVTGNDPSSCALGIGARHTGSREMNLNSANVQWRDDAGVLFTAARVAQPADNYFEILECAEFQPNDRGERTRLITFRVNVVLGDGHRSIRFRSEKAVMAVAYK